MADNTVLDEAILVAYADGELDAETACEVERALEENPDAKALLADLVSSAGYVRSAFAAYANEPIPERILDDVRTAPEAGTGGKHDLGWAVQKRLRAYIALAASVAFLGIGFGSGMMVSDHVAGESSTPFEAARAMQFIEAERAFNEVLENNLSGTSVKWQASDDGLGLTVTPTKTYRSSTSGFCREYRIERDYQERHETERGLACRESDGRWVPRYVIIESGPNSV